MPRPPLALGTWGDLRTHVATVDEKGRPASFRAIAKYRDHDGRTRQVERYGRTKAAALNALRTALKERSSVGRQGALIGTDRFNVAAKLWMEKLEALVDEGVRSPGTVGTYEKHLANHVLPALGELRLAEVTTPLVDKFIGRTKKNVGVPTARACRSVVSGIMGLAVRYGAIMSNPVRDIDRIEGQTQKEPRGLTAKERVAWMAQLASDEDAVRKDLPDLTTFMLGTGARIGEALAVLWSEVDLQGGTVSITSTIIRVKGEGLLRTRTKSRAGQRVLVLPSWVVAMLTRRFTAGVQLDKPVFPDSLGGFRDPSNTSRDLREARGTADLSWVTSHTFRKTLATMLDDAGLSPRAVADQLGHARPSMTQDVYMSRKVLNPHAATAIEGALDNPPEQKDG